MWNFTRLKRYCEPLVRLLIILATQLFYKFQIPTLSSIKNQQTLFDFRLKRLIDEHK